MTAHITPGGDERRAVIDIGSNTVRLVIYGSPARAPSVLWNEKVAARLGRDLARTGAIPDIAMEEALAALARYAQVLADMGIRQVEAVATAAPREASNGAEFLASAAALGLNVKLLSGEDEARASAWGAIGAFPGAEGIVADLGGGSLELVPVRDATCGTGVSLPLGTLRLPALRAKSSFSRKVGKMLSSVDIDLRNSAPLYMIGGTWRAFAVHAMREADYPLTDPHGFRFGAREAADLAKALESADPEKLSQTPGISSMRAEKLPDAAALLRILLDRINPKRLTFSSWGLREGLHFQRLPAQTREQDPLLAGITHFSPAPLPGMADAGLLCEWTAQVASAKDTARDRIRLAAAHLAQALHEVEPNLRTAHALEWALDKRWIAITPAERAELAAMLLASLNQTGLPDRVTQLCSSSRLERAVVAGLSLRLARRLGAGASTPLRASRLTAKGGTLRLFLSSHHAALAPPLVGKDLTALANTLGLKPALEIEG